MTRSPGTSRLRTQQDVDQCSLAGSFEHALDAVVDMAGEVSTSSGEPAPVTGGNGHPEPPSAEPETRDENEEAIGRPWLHWSIAYLYYDVPNIENDEQVVSYGMAGLRDGGFGFHGMLILTDQRLIFGRKRPKRPKIAAKVQFSVRISDIELIERITRFRFFRRLRFTLVNGDQFELNVRDREAWIEVVVREHDRLFDKFNSEDVRRSG